MGKFAKYSFFIVVVLIVVLAAGPVVTKDETIHAISIPDNVEKYIQDGERQFTDIRRGTEKQIVWHNPEQHQPTPVSIVYLHGFSASRQEVAPLCDQLAAQLGANIFYTRLTGHGRDNEAMNQATVNAFLNDAVEALEIGKKIGNKVILIGTSTGGTLATWLASHYDNHQILALILLSPNYGFKRSDTELLLWPWGNLIARLVIGEYYHFKPVNDMQARYWTTTYPSQALLPMMGLVDVIRNAPLETIQSPTLALYSEHDQLIDVNTVKNTIGKFAAPEKQISVISNSGDPQQHILAGDILSPQTTDQVTAIIANFIQALL